MREQRLSAKAGEALAPDVQTSPKFYEIIERDEAFYAEADFCEDKWTVINAGPILEWDGAPVVAIDRGEMYPDADLGNHITSVGLSYFGQSVRDAFVKEAISGIQWLPVTLSGVEPREQFYYMHITTCAPVLNVEQSDYVRYFDKNSLPSVRGKISGLIGPCVNAEVLPGVDVFRIAEYAMVALASEKVRDVCQKWGFSFWLFEPVKVAQWVVN